MRFNPLPLIATSIVTISICGLFVWMGATGWPGETGRTALEFCEAIRPGPIKQPANTWSNIGFLAVALSAAWQAGRDLATPKSTRFTNSIVADPLYATTYCVISALIGLGSTALHASTTVWGARCDIYAMFLWITWTISYTMMRCLRRNDRGTFAMFFVPIAAILAMKVFVPTSYEQLGNSTLFGILVVVSVSLEIVTRWRRPELTASMAYFCCGVVSFLLAFAAWIPSRTGSALCYPDSLWQGHALWHILCAAAVGFIYLYGRSERIAMTESPRL
jgi:hypothetical protein